LIHIEIINRNPLGISPTTAKSYFLSSLAKYVIVVPNII
jgi:hypothetical protein